jgi:hypothetical protein
MRNRSEIYIKEEGRYTKILFSNGNEFNTEENRLYCDYFTWCVCCTVVVLTCLLMSGFVYMWVL